MEQEEEVVDVSEIKEAILYGSPFWLDYYKTFPREVTPTKGEIFFGNNSVAMEERDLGRADGRMTEFQAFGVSIPLFDSIIKASDPNDKNHELFVEVRDSLLDLAGMEEDGKWGQLLITGKAYDMEKNDPTLKQLKDSLYLFAHIVFAYKSKDFLKGNLKGDLIAEDLIEDDRTVAYGRAIFYSLAHFYRKKLDLMFLANQLLEYDKEWYLVKYQQDEDQWQAIQRIFNVLFVRLYFGIRIWYRSRMMETLLKNTGAPIPNSFHSRFNPPGAARSLSPGATEQIDILWKEVISRHSKVMQGNHWVGSQSAATSEENGFVNANSNEIRTFGDENAQKFNTYYIRNLTLQTKKTEGIVKMDDYYAAYDRNLTSTITELSSVTIPNVTPRIVESYTQQSTYDPWFLPIIKIEGGQRKEKKIKWFSAEFPANLNTFGRDKFQKFLDRQRINSG